METPDHKIIGPPGALVVSLPMRDGNRWLKPRKMSEYSVVSLPMRDGNPFFHQVAFV